MKFTARHFTRNGKRLPAAKRDSKSNKHVTQAAWESRGTESMDRSHQLLSLLFIFSFLKTSSKYVKNFLSAFCNFANCSVVGVKQEQTFTLKS
jgi:hypothetical protein